MRIAFRGKAEKRRYAPSLSFGFFLSGLVGQYYARRHASLWAMLASRVADDPEAELEALQQQQAALKAELDAERKKLLEIQRKKKRLIENRIRRQQYRLSLQARKRDTRRKILAGSWVLAVAEQDQDAGNRLRKGLDEFLERDQDRELFGLTPREERDQRATPTTTETHDA